MVLSAALLQPAESSREAPNIEKPSAVDSLDGLDNLDSFIGEKMSFHRSKMQIPATKKMACQKDRPC
jgi:hypothetical protein